MAKYNSLIVGGFDIQTGLGAYNANLAGRTSGGTWGGDSSGTDQGLLLGDENQGINGSGLTFTLGRQGKEQSVIGSSLTRPLSLFELANVASFTYAFPFGGNLSDTTVTTPVDGDFVALTAVDAILRALGMASNTDLSPGIQYRYVTATQEYASFLGYVNKQEVRFKDCVTTSAQFTFEAGKAPICVATMEVGVVDLPASATPQAAPAVPTLSYGNQQTVSPAIVENVSHTWEHARGFSTLVIDCTNTVVRTPDSNQEDGVVIQITGRETKVTATMYDDDSGTNEGYTYSQLFQTGSGGLDPITFQVGTTADATSSPAEALSITIPQPELISAQPTLIGTSAGYDVELLCRHSTANLEIDFDFI